MKSHKTTTHMRVAAVLCALYVILGAFGAHGLENILSPDQKATYETGLRYFIIHALGLFIVQIIYYIKENYNPYPSRFFYLGMLLFSASLILHALKDILGIDVNVFARLAPIGGLSYIVGWLVFAYTLARK